jgi:uncharacterized protein with NRDE domain
MCLILFALNHHPEFPLVVAANRDEFFNRPTLSVHYWDEDPRLLGGKDQLAGGTWMGLRKDGKFAAVTNYRDPREMKTDALSRGRLTTDFLLSNINAVDYLDALQKNADLYNGFNLLISDTSSVFFHYSNISKRRTELQQGIFGLSNHLLDTPWPKVERGKKQLRETLDSGIPDHDKVFDLLSNKELALENELPSTGIAIELEKQLSPMFIRMKGYGTRCSTSILINKERQVSFSEITFNEMEEITEKHVYAFNITD